MRTKRYVFIAISVLLVSVARRGGTAATERFRFAILGDRTGEARPGVYEQVWQETAAEHPAFAVSVGDTIEGLNDETAESQWQDVERLLRPYRRNPLYLTPGNHDVWSAASERLFRAHAEHPPHYGFDYAQAHFTILDNSRSDELSAEELAFLEKDLKDHRAQPVKFVFMHRPSWLIPVALRNPDFPLHQLALRYGVRYVIAGHVHEILHAEFQGVMYLSMPSSGGHLRNPGLYEDGWFFGHALVDVNENGIQFRIEELRTPRGQGRSTKPADWSLLGLVEKPAPAAGHRAAGGSRSAGMPAK